MAVKVTDTTPIHITMNDGQHFWRGCFGPYCVRQGYGLSQARLIVEMLNSLEATGEYRLNNDFVMRLWRREARPEPSDSRGEQLSERLLANLNAFVGDRHATATLHSEAGAALITAIERFGDQIGEPDFAKTVGTALAMASR